jgi:hypothetical protein
MAEKVIRLCDYETRSRTADACQPRNPADAQIIIMPDEVERFQRVVLDRIRREMGR